MQHSVLYKLIDYLRRSLEAKLLPHRNTEHTAYSNETTPSLQ